MAGAGAEIDRAPAGPGACDEGPVPKELPGAMLPDPLAGQGITVSSVRLRYPAEP
jgi:hypothetical protein